MTPGDADSPHAARPSHAAGPDDPARLIDDRDRLYDAAATLPERRLSLGWLDALVRHRRVAFALVALLHLASFNGFWRVNVDAALYRGLGHSLATGRGYTFAGEPHHHAYFGLPVLLAAFERLAGPERVWPAQLLIAAMALATVAMTYRLIALQYPTWIATIVAIATGVNFRFLRLSQELMTDVPFALGVVVTLYGLERLRMIARGDRRAMARAAGTMLAGLMLAATMRPTVAVLVGAIVAASVVRAIRAEPGRRALHVTIVACAAVAVLAFGVFDHLTRTRGISIFRGVYEQEFIAGVGALPTAFLGKLEMFLGSSLNDAFFSQKLQPLSIPVALVVLGGAALVARRNLAWGLMVAGVVAITLPLSTAPRYYLMVMPILWLGWLLLFARLTLAAPPVLRGAVMLLAIAVPLAMNLGRDSGLVREQHAGDVDWLRGRQPTREAAFYARYRGGEVPRQRAMAAVIAARAGPNDRVLGPAARVLSFFADRRVSGDRELFDERDVSRRRMPAALENFKPDLAVFPAGAYGDADRNLRDLVKRRILAPQGRVLGRVDFAWLAAVEVRPPPPGVDWKDWKAPDPRKSPATRATKGKGASATQRAAAADRRERRADAERRAQRQAKRDRAAERTLAQAKHERAMKRQQDEKRAAQIARDRRDAQAAKDRRDAQSAKHRKQRESRPKTTRPATQP